ncbi:hypothetical protein HPDP_00036 [Candidatus Hepatincola sp. Pdp]
MKKIIYKITYSNVYIGSDVSYSIRYFGSRTASYIEKDFTEEEQMDFTINKKILWYTNDELIPNSDVLKKEMEFIREYQSNNPQIGYNKNPKYKPEHNLRKQK